MRQEDPYFTPKAKAIQNGDDSHQNGIGKRARDYDESNDMHQLKKERVDEDEEEEMELDDDDDPSTKNNQPAPTGMYYLILDTIKPLTMNLMCKRGARGSSAAFYATPLYKFTARSY